MPVIIIGIAYMEDWDISNATIVGGGIGMPYVNMKVVAVPGTHIRSTLRFYYEFNTTSLGPMILDNFYESEIDIE